MSNIISNSPNISLLESAITADTCGGNFIIDLTPSTFVGTGADNMLGAKVRITNPYGVAIKDYGIGFDINPPFDGSYSIGIPTEAGNYQYGQYKVDVEITDANNTTYSVSKTLELCYPDKKNKTRNYGTLSATIRAACSEGKVYVAIDTPPTYNGILSSAVDQSYELEYPSGSGLGNRTVTHSYFSDYLFEGVYKITGEACVTYADEDNVSYKVKYKVKYKKEVFCQIDECAVLANLQQLDAQLSKNCSEDERLKLSAKSLDALRLLKTAQLANDCGQDASEYISQLEDLLECKCTCEIGNTPIVNTTPAKDVLIDGCGVELSVDGLTTHYTINAKTYIVTVDPNGGCLVASDPQVSGCNSTTRLTFDIGQVYTKIKDIANATMEEAAFWSAIANKPLVTVNPANIGVAQEEWDAMLLADRVQAIIAAISGTAPLPTFDNGVTEITAGDATTASINGLGGQLTQHTTIGGDFALSLTEGSFGVGREALMVFDVVKDGGAFSFNGKQAFIFDINLNTTIGDQAAQFNTTSSQGIFIGTHVAYAASGDHQIALGNSAGHTVVGDDGIYIGRFSGLSTDGRRNVMIATLAGANTFTDESVLIGYNSSAGAEVVSTAIPNTSFALNDTTFSGTEVASIITAAGLSAGDRAAMSFSSSSIQIGGVALTGGGLSFKGLVIDANTIEMLYQGQFTSQGSGNTTVKVYAETNNVTVLGRNAHATTSNQVVLGDEFVTGLKIGNAILHINGNSVGLPRMTTTQRDALTGMTGGDMVYDTTVNKTSQYNGTIWKYLAYE